MPARNIFPRSAQPQLDKNTHLGKLNFPFRKLVAVTEGHFFVICDSHQMKCMPNYTKHIFCINYLCSYFINHSQFLRGYIFCGKAGMLSLKLEISVEFLKFRKSVYKRIFEQRCYMLIYHNLYDDFLRP